MTADEIIRKAEEVAEESYSVSVWENMLESVLADLTPVAKVSANSTASVTLTDNAADVSVPSGAYEVIGVGFVPTSKRKVPLRKVSSADSASVGWYRRGAHVILQNIPYTGSVSIDYYAILTNTAGVLNLPEEYHEIVLKGLMALAMQKEEDMGRKNDFYGEYSLMKRQMLADRIMAMEPWNAYLLQGGGK